MTTDKENKKNNISADAFYGCCPVCKHPLVQAKNGMDGIIKCPKCNNYIHIEIEDDIVTVTRSQNEE